ncbi:MAG: hypothetical protein ACREH3_16885, partial [Geminicoccales bacterium]
LGKTKYDAEVVPITVDVGQGAEEIEGATADEGLPGQERQQGEDDQRRQLGQHPEPWPAARLVGRRSLGGTDGKHYIGREAAGRRQGRQARVDAVDVVQRLFVWGRRSRRSAIAWRRY